MTDLSFEPTGGAEQTGLSSDFLETEGADLLGRWSCHQAYWEARLAAGLDPYFRTSTERIGPSSTVLTRGQERLVGVNFASQDYLSLSSHPAIRAAAIEAVGRWGVHGSGSPAQQGGSAPVTTLEERFAELLCCREVTTFPTGWAAGYGVVRALVRNNDHIVIDALAHTCLQDGSVNATRNVHRVPNCSHAAVEQRLAKIRECDPRAGILVITESLFSLNSTVPDLRALQEKCRAYQATLLVDVSHDLGAMGDGGLGFLGEQGMLGEIDLVMGSLATTFVSNGGFIASSAPGIKQALRSFADPLLYSNALSPVQASIVNAALDVVRSREGAERRRRLIRNASRLRDALAARAFRVLGQPSVIVPVWLGGIAEARLMTRAALSGGGLVSLVEHPVVARGHSRWWLQVMADHTDEQIDQFVAIAVAARETVKPPAATPRVVDMTSERQQTGVRSEESC